MIQRVSLAGSPTLLLEWSILQFTEWWYFTPTRFACIVLHCHIEDPCLKPGFVDMMRSKSHYRFEDVVLIDFSSIHPSLPYNDILSHLFSFGQTWIFRLHFSTWDWCYFACEPFHLLYFSDGVETNHHLVLKMERIFASCFVKTWIRSCWLWRLRLHWCQAGQPANVGVNRFSQPILPLGVSRGYEENIPTHEPRGNYRITVIFVLFFVDPSTCCMCCSFGEVWRCVFWR